MLNEGQQKALTKILRWYKSSECFCILNGSGGVGKSFLVNEVCKELGVKTLLTAPTHEALKQLKDKIDENPDYLYKTVHSSLGISPTTEGKELKFEQNKLPNLWNNFELCIIDEVSMLDDWLLDILCSIGIKILFVGHESQLPPVVPKRKVFDKCISPVFKLSCTKVTLTEPVRNTGKLWDFNEYLENNIYTTNKLIPKDFDICKADLLTLLKSDDAKYMFLNGNLKIALWSNAGVDRLNKKVRETIFGSDAVNNLYLPKDKLIITAPLTVIDGLETYTETTLGNQANKNCDVLYSNSKLEVVSCETLTVNLNKFNNLLCYKLNVLCEEGNINIYTCVNQDDKTKLSKFLEHKAWGESNKVERAKAYLKRHFILSCFADIKHFYAATSHRLQGSTIDSVIVINSDIVSNANQIEQNKCRYVATSRAAKNLYFYRGLL